MKFKTTKKELNKNYYYIVRAGYCELQTLLNRGGAREVAYACGVYGWNWDAYEVESSNGDVICVCTGYRDMTGKRLEGLTQFEERAKNIRDFDELTTYEERAKMRKNLLTQFADYVVKNYNN